MDAMVFGSDLYFGIIFNWVGRTLPETNPFVAALVGVSVVAAGAALYRLGQTLALGEVRRDLWQTQYLRNRSSSRPPTNPV